MVEGGTVTIEDVVKVVLEVEGVVEILGEEEVEDVEPVEIFTDWRRNRTMASSLASAETPVMVDSMARNRGPRTFILNRWVDNYH